MCGEMQLNIIDFYQLTPKEFFAYREGFIGIRDADSKERLLLTRKLMYASLAPYSKNLKEVQIMEFEWEKDTIKKLTEEEALEAEIEVRESINFWKKYDSGKRGSC